MPDTRATTLISMPPGARPEPLSMRFSGQSWSIVRMTSEPNSAASLSQNATWQTSRTEPWPGRSILLLPPSRPGSSTYLMRNLAVLSHAGLAG